MLSELTSFTSSSPTMTKCLTGICVFVRKTALLTETCNMLQYGEPSTVKTTISLGFEHLMIVASFSTSPLNPSASGQDDKTTRFSENLSRSFACIGGIHSPIRRRGAPLRNGALTHVSISFKDLALDRELIDLEVDEGAAIYVTISSSLCISFALFISRAILSPMLILRWYMAFAYWEPMPMCTFVPPPCLNATSCVTGTCI